MSRPRRPDRLAAGGRRLWDEITGEHDLDAAQLVQLEEACRAKDRLDRLDTLVRGEAEHWRELSPQTTGREPYALTVANPIGLANTTADLMKQLLAALRLPDPSTGRRPQYRGPRGSQKPRIPNGAVWRPGIRI